MTNNVLNRTRNLSGFAGSILIAGLALAATGTAGAQGLSAARADVDDDGFVGISDLTTVFSKFGLRNGDTGFREGLDLTGDGIINYDDVAALFPFYYQSGLPTDPTTVSGVVYDGFGAALQNVEVSIGAGGGPSVMTASNGSYQITVPGGMTGDSEINFDGSTAIDPSPNVLSSQFPNIPHKPLFINGGTSNVFRAMSLPERDFNGSVFLNAGNSTDNGGGSYTMTTDVSYRNPAAAGAAMTVPSGATVIFPPGESPRLSVMNVDPAFSPAPLPPGAGSTNVFVSFQPGGTTIAPSASPLVVCFDNIDLFTNIYTDGAFTPDHPDQPMLLGVEGGVFQKVATVIVTDATGVPSAEGVAGPKLLATIDLSGGFTFAWYPVVQTLEPCDPTTVIGVVKDFAVNPAGDPVGGATVSIPGYSPVTTNAAGAFSIPNVVAGPNGPRCFTNPFSLRASAVIDLDGDGTPEQGSSNFFPGVSGGTTNVGCIPLRGQGTVQGKLRKLVKIDPNTVEFLAGVEVSLTSGGNTVTTTTNAGGCYSFTNIAAGGGYTVEISDLEFDQDGCIGDITQGGFLGGVGEVDVLDFRFIGTGKSKVTLTDELGNPLEFYEVNMFSFFNEELGGGFVSPFRSEFDFTDENGCATFLNIPLGTYEVSSSEGFPESTPPPGEIGGNFAFVQNVINCDGQCNEDALEITPPNFDSCDLGPVAITPVSIDSVPPFPPVANVEFALTFLEPLETFDIDMEINIYLDTDLDTTTGTNRFTPGGQITGIERIFTCFVEPFGDFGVGSCNFNSYNANGSFAGSLSSPLASFQADPSDPATIILTVPNDALLGEDLIGSTQARVYVAVFCFPQSKAGGFGEDIWPNLFDPAPAAIDLTAPFSDTDPFGDIITDGGGFPE